MTLLPKVVCCKAALRESGISNDCVFAEISRTSYALFMAAAPGAMRMVLVAAQMTM